MSSHVSKNNNNTPRLGGRPSWIKQHKTGIIVLISLFMAIILFDISPLGGNIRFYSKWVECGQKPVAANLEWSVGGGTPPNYGTPPTFSLMRLSPEYFCTPLEAEQAGYSASADRYYFPHLEEGW